MKTEIWLIYSPSKPTHRRLSFKNDITTFERGLGWVAQKISGDMMELPVVEAGCFSREALKAHGDVNSAQPEQGPVAYPCIVVDVDYSMDTAAILIQDTRDYEFNNGQYWLTTTPPQRKPLTHEQRFDLLTKFEPHKNKWEASAILIDMVEAAHGIKENA